jgi:hypothetical protein
MRSEKVVSIDEHPDYESDEDRVVNLNQGTEVLGEFNIPDILDTGPEGEESPRDANG